MCPKQETQGIVIAAKAARVPGQGLRLIGAGLLKAGKLALTGAKIGASAVATGSKATASTVSRIAREARRQAMIETITQAHRQGKLTMAQRAEAEKLGITFSASGGVVTSTEVVHKDQVSAALAWLAQDEEPATVITTATETATETEKTLPLVPTND